MSAGSRDATDLLHGKLNDIENHSFVDREESFVVSDGTGTKRTTTTQPNAIAAKERLQRTPANRHIFKDLTNQRSSTNRREFTPLLQSAMRNSSLKQLTSSDMPQEPDINAKSPGLPPNGDDVGDFSTSMEEVTRSSIRQPVQLESENSTPIPRRGASGADNMLTLREQEKAINEMQKENFSLKLRIFFLTQHMKSTTPEALSGTLQENVEMKAEQVAMKTELTKLKKQLTESESKVAQLTANIAADLSTQDDLTDDERARLEQLVADNKKTNDELFDARAAIQKLQQEMEEYRTQLEESDGEHTEVEDLKATIAQLEDEIDRLKDENQSLSDELNAKVQQMERTSQDLKDAELQIQGLQETVDELQSEDDSKKDHVGLTLERLNHKNVVEEMQQRITDLAIELQKAQADAAVSKTKADKAVNQLQELLNGALDNPLESSHTDKLEVELMSLHAKNDRLEEELKQVRDQRELETRHKAELDNAHKQIESLKLTIDQAKRAYQLHLDEPRLHELKQSVLESQTKVELLERTVGDKNAEIADLTLKLKESEGMSRVTVDNMLKTYQMQIDDEAELKEDAQRKSDTLSKKNIELNKKIQGFQKVVRERDTELSKLQAQLESGSAKSFKNDRDQIKAQLKASQMELEAFKEQATIQEKNLHSAIKNLEYERDDVLNMYHAAKKELEANQASFKEKLETLLTQSTKKDRDLQAFARSQNQVHILEREISKLTKQHKGELKGLAMQIQYLRAKGDRDRGFRADSAFMKNFFLLQISSFESCNKANLYMLEQMGIYPEKKYHDKRPTLKAVAHMVIAAIRVRNLKNEWMAQQRTKEMLAKSLQNLKCARNMNGFRW
ncbi:hypothetical protein POJ06DRAFT_251812 [Lipomyces tetrasporus]|uniref:Centrosomin N-terminal motif 1 domain-containing protein n=1 Tax=Lipomyces tetrasporus TaxID=54092 RepID=A0AAD7QUC0_9ASCO|nr:uncharacterized protein POJ06DRAFT_251812 [Lipomyces tetrasporus]KAJ8101550.1 hypothetical protein POJ06DRAFT_251812 [Lipomyces tetrasporus]